MAFPLIQWKSIRGSGEYKHLQAYKRIYTQGINRVRITIDQIRHFQEIAKHNSINTAARFLNISPSAISRSLKIIEEDLTQELFTRAKGKIILNRAGKEFLNHSKTVIRHYNQLCKVENSPSESIKVKIGGSHWLAGHYLPHCLSSTPRKFTPKIQFDIASLDTQRAISKVVDGDLDMALCFSPKPHSDLNSYLIWRGDLKLCVGKNRKLAKMKWRDAFSQLNKIPGIVHKPSEFAATCDDHPMFQKFDIRPQFDIYWDSDLTAIELLKTNDYWTMLPDLVIEHNPNIVALNHPTTWKAQYEIHLLWHTRNNPECLNDLIEMFTNV